MSKNRALRKQNSLQKEIQQNAIYKNCATAKPRLIQYPKRSNFSALALAVTLSLSYDLLASDNMKPDDTKVPYDRAKTKRLQTIMSSIEGLRVVARTSRDQDKQFKAKFDRQKEYAPEIKQLLEENADPAAIKMLILDHGLPSTLAMDPIILETCLLRGCKPDNTKTNSSLHRLCDYNGLWDKQYLSQTLNIVALLRFLAQIQRLKTL
jgi:hypothetical protein